MIGEAREGKRGYDFAIVRSARGGLLQRGEDYRIVRPLQSRFESAIGIRS